MVRFKNRYLLVEYRLAGKYQNKPTLTKDDLFGAVKNSVKENFGEYGLSVLYIGLQSTRHQQNFITPSKAKLIFNFLLLVKYFNDDTQTFIIRCSHAHHKILWSAITLVTKIRDEPASLSVLHVGGTVPCFLALFIVLITLLSYYFFMPD